MNTRSVAHTAQTIDKTVPTADQAASGHIKLTIASAETTGIATTLVSAITTRDMSPVSDKEFIESVHSTDSVLAHAGRESRMSQDIPQEYMIINDEQSHMFETLIYNEMGDQNDNDKRLVVPIYFEGLQFEALIDSGATKSFIDKSLVEALKIEGSQSEALQTDEQTHRLCQRQHQMKKPSVLPLETPIEELTDKFKKLKAQFMSEIQDSIKDNAQIPLDSYCTLPEMHVFLDVPEGTTIYRRPRTFAEQQQHIFDEQVDKWLKDGVITLAPANNRHNNTLTLAAKKDLLGNKTKWRVCLDPRPLNKLLKDDNHPVPLISDILQQIGGHMIYTTLDLTQAYHRLPIEAGHQPLTAFMHRGTQYMFRRAPFGLKPLSSIFQRGMTRILGDLPFVLVFIDDIVIFSKTKEEHAAHVKCVIERLTEAKLIINPEKSHFFSTQIVLLGFVIDLAGKRVDPTKLANIDQWVPPTTGTQIQSYMGTFNFFPEFIPLFSTLAAPLDKLRHETKAFKLNADELDAFNTFKQLLSHAPILHFADFGLSFYVATDASNVGIASVLYQKVRNESKKKWENRYISFMARSLQDRERRYSATQKELLGIVFALTKFHYYLWGRHFTLYTDHRALTFIHSQKELNSMLTGWHETILSYDFTVEYRPGVMNVLPDHLSRLFPASIQTRYDSNHGHIVNAYMHIMQNKDTMLEVVHGKKKQDDILNKTHALGHLGANAMVRSIHAEQYTWPHLTDDCLNWVKKCSECQKYNISIKGYHPLKAIHANLPGDHMAMDLAGPFKLSKKGNEILLIVVDVCTRFVFLRALPDKQANTVAKALFDIFCTVGFPRVLQSDNGREFVNQVMLAMTSEFNVDHRLLTPYHPRGNGVAERHVKVAVDILKKEHHQKQDTWDLHVPMAQLAMNTRIVALHNSSPFSLFFARKANGFRNYSKSTKNVMTHKQLCDRLAYMTEIVFPAIDKKSEETQKKMIARFNATVLHNEFPDGAKVMTLDPIRGNKLTPRYEGPYTVVRRTTGGSYELRDGTGESLSRNYAPSQLKLVLEDLNTLPIFEIEYILDHRPHPSRKGEWEYKAKWAGYSKDDYSWEPEENVIEKQCIREYWQLLKENKRPQDQRSKRYQTRMRN
ncbi:hypothetical protein EMPS_07867 [Entomortierella parvispora]|uniref:RNA-directed DNA polymerase n=1 Tax=Entomortierella parvispora TaxID=205924 RepID=A0A9P3HF36_9FUNG|nr:hypothetical protein EMPS_07867 [Entomortierella parvispora]